MWGCDYFHDVVTNFARYRDWFFHGVVVEACLSENMSGESKTTLHDAIEEYLRCTLKLVIVGTTITTFQSSILTLHIKSLSICEAKGISADVIDVSMVQLYLHLYHTNTNDPVRESNDDESNITSTHQWTLPSSAFAELWESLIYDNGIKEELLDYVHACSRLSDHKINENIISWNRIIFLHGPPGTGKTSLCRALAQKLSIRLLRRYAYGRLVEINAHSLFSKWFSESGKMVIKMFERIRSFCEDPDAFVCILIDEVESLAACRHATEGGEPSDAIRVVNAMLTQLDKLKQYQNVLVLTTSNLSSAIDLAFIDRADLNLYVGPPSQPAVYAILRSCLIELVRAGVIGNDSTDAPLLDGQSAALVYSNDVDSQEINLWNLSQKCRGFTQLLLQHTLLGMSGRSLRKLPIRAIANVLPDVNGHIGMNSMLISLFRCAVANISAK